MKRCFDILVCFVALLVLSPVVLILSVMVRIKLGSPVMFKQVRPGVLEIPFEMVKFRTMTEAQCAWC